MVYGSLWKGKWDVLRFDLKQESREGFWPFLPVPAPGGWIAGTPPACLWRWPTCTTPCPSSSRCTTTTWHWMGWPLRSWKTSSCRRSGRTSPARPRRRWRPWTLTPTSGSRTTSAWSWRWRPLCCVCMVPCWETWSMSRYGNCKGVVVRMRPLLRLRSFRSASCLGMASFISCRPVDARVGLNKIHFLYIYIYVFCKHNNSSHSNGIDKTY